MELEVDRDSTGSGAPEPPLLAAENQHRKRLSGAARKRYRRLVEQGSSVEEALELCGKPWRDLFGKKPAQENPLERARAEEQEPAKKTPKLSTAGDARPRKEGYSRVGIQNSEPMNEDQMKLIHHHLNLAIAKQSADGDGPQFLGFTHKTGWILVTCVDQHSQDWLAGEISKLKPWPYARLSVIPETELPKPITALTFVPESEAASVGEAIALLKAQNKGLNTELWRVLNEKVEPAGRVITFAMDDPSIDTLRASNFEAAIGFKRVFFKIKGGTSSSTQPAPTSRQHGPGTQSLDIQNYDGRTAGQWRETDNMVGQAGPSPAAGSTRSAPTDPRHPMHETQPNSFQSRGATYGDQRKETGRMVSRNGPLSFAASTQASAPTSSRVPGNETQGFPSCGGTYEAQRKKAGRMVGGNRPLSLGGSTQPPQRQQLMSGSQPEDFYHRGSTYTDHRRETDRLEGWNGSANPASTLKQQCSAPGSQLKDFHSRAKYTGQIRETDRMVGRNGPTNSAARTPQQQHSIYSNHPDDFHSHNGRFTSQRRDRDGMDDRDSQRQQYEYSNLGSQREDFRSRDGSYTDQRKADGMFRRNEPSTSTQQQCPVFNSQLEDFRRHDDSFTSQRRESDRSIGQNESWTSASAQEQYPMCDTRPKDFHSRGSSFTDLRRERGTVDDWDTQFEYPIPGTQPQVLRRHGDTYISLRDSDRRDDGVKPSTAERGWQTGSRDRSERIPGRGVSWPDQGRPRPYPTRPVGARGRGRRL